MGLRVVDLPDSTRIAGLRAVERLQLRDLTERILQIDPPYCSLPVRRAAAEVLTALSGRQHAPRPHARTVELFLRDLGRVEDEAELKLPICYAVQDP